MQKAFYILSLTLMVAMNPGDDKDTYKKEIDAWHEKRVASLKSETGWLNIVGLHWLHEGENTFGSGADNAIVFPEGKADERVGVFTLKDGNVWLKAEPGVDLKFNGKPFTEDIVFTEKMEKPAVIEHRNLRWFIIKRGERYGVRLRDLESDALKNFTHIDRFPVDEKWRITATLKKAKKEETIAIQDVIGNTTETPLGGTLHFKIEGNEYELDATREGEELFIVFADETTGSTTYGGGRFLYTKYPTKGKEVILDFNKAYNPPCVFTDFATCPLPTPENRLKVSITAGEKSYGQH